MNLTEWITKEDLSIKEFAEEFVNVVKENFGEHNYKCVTDIVNKHLANGADTRTELALPIQSVMASVSDELLLRAVKYEDEANADFDTDGVQHNLNIGRYDGLMQAVQEINKHLP